jgi:hypothetical protein
MIHLAKGITGKTRCGRRVKVAGTSNLSIVPSSEFDKCDDRCKRCQNWKPKTKSEKIVDTLERAGFIESDPTSKYRKFYKDSGNFFFVGKSGALRFGPTAGKSQSLTHNLDTVLERLRR